MTNDENSADRVLENDAERDLEEVIDAKPKKNIIKNKAMRCSFENAMAEIIDNCIDYWTEIERVKTLKIDIAVENPNEKNQVVAVTWNMGVPKERWYPLLTPGAPMHKSIEAIGVWGEGFKIAIFSTGKKIDVFTDNGGIRHQIDIPREFLVVEDWKIPVYKGIEKGVGLETDHTLVRLSGQAYNEPPSTRADQIFKEFIGETFGTRVVYEKEQGYDIEIRFNGELIKPITYGSEEDIKKNFSFPPGFEPSEHIFNEAGMKIRLVIGLLHTMDAVNYGVYMYGNGRLFAKRMRNEVVGFGTRANSKIPADHPLAKRLQIHVFFEGSPENIPWQAPLKDQVLERHPTINRVAEYIKVHARPYAEFMINAQDPELKMFSIKRNGLSEEQKKNLILSQEDRRKRNKNLISGEEIDEAWNNLPDSLKRDFYPPSIDTWDHGDSNKGRKTVEAPKFDMKYVKPMIALLKERDKEELGSFDLVAKLEGGFATAIPSPPTSKGKDTFTEVAGGQSTGTYVDEGSTTLSIRLEASEARELSEKVGGSNKTEMLRRMIDTYKMVYSLKNHPYFQKNRQNLDDEEFLEELQGILDEKISKKK